MQRKFPHSVNKTKAVYVARAGTRNSGKQYLKPGQTKHCYRIVFVQLPAAAHITGRHSKPHGVQSCRTRLVQRQLVVSRLALQQVEQFSLCRVEIAWWLWIFLLVKRLFFHRHVRLDRWLCTTVTKRFLVHHVRTEWRFWTTLGLL